MLLLLSPIIVDYDYDYESETRTILSLSVLSLVCVRLLLFSVGQWSTGALVSVSASFSRLASPLLSFLLIPFSSCVPQLTSRMPLAPLPSVFLELPLERPFTVLVLVLMPLLYENVLLASGERFYFLGYGPTLYAPEELFCNSGCHLRGGVQCSLLTFTSRIVLLLIAVAPSLWPAGRPSARPALGRHLRVVSSRLDCLLARRLK